MIRPKQWTLATALLATVSMAFVPGCGKSDSGEPTAEQKEAAANKAPGATQTPSASARLLAVKFHHDL